MSETNTYKNYFNSALSEVIITGVLKRVSECAQQFKGVSINVDEMLLWLDAPAPLANSTVKPPPTAAPMIQMQMPNMGQSLPSYLRGTGAVTPTGNKKGQGTGSGRGRKKAVVTSTAPDPELPPCKYVFQRGDRKGHLCGEPSEPNGSGYCKACLKKQSVKNDITQKPGSSPNDSSSQNQTIPDGMLISAPIENNTTDSSELSLEVISDPERPGFFIEQSKGFIIQQLPDGTAVAFAIADGQSERDLTNDERELALAMGLALSDDRQVVPQLPTIPQIPVR